MWAMLIVLVGGFFIGCGSGSNSKESKKESKKETQPKTISDELLDLTIECNLLLDSINDLYDEHVLGRSDKFYKGEGKTIFDKHFLNRYINITMRLDDFKSMHAKMWRDDDYDNQYAARYDSLLTVYNEGRENHIFGYGSTESFVNKKFEEIFEECNLTETDLMEITEKLVKAAEEKLSKELEGYKEIKDKFKIK
jgi:hypothetical protein